jgi:hypothetical protein
MKSIEATQNVGFGVTLNNHVRADVRFRRAKPVHFALHSDSG